MCILQELINPTLITFDTFEYQLSSLQTPGYGHFLQRVEKRSENTVFKIIYSETTHSSVCATTNSGYGKMIKLRLVISIFFQLYVSIHLFNVLVSAGSIIIQ